MPIQIFIMKIEFYNEDKFLEIVSYKNIYLLSDNQKTLE